MEQLEQQQKVTKDIIAGTQAAILGSIANGDYSQLDKLSTLLALNLQYDDNLRGQIEFLNTQGQDREG